VPEWFDPLLADVAHDLYRNLWKPCLKMFDKYLSDPVFLSAFGVVALLEWLRPAKPHQKLFDTGVIQDFVWVFFSAITKTLFIAGYVKLMSKFYERHLDFLTVEATADLPMWLRVVWGVVLLDFLRWVQHWLQHKIPWAWRFHSLHHSQRQLNFFSDFRGHAFEDFVRHTVCVIPMLMLSVDRPYIVLLAVLIRAHSCLYHANIRSNFGFLGRFFVNPQSHRVHHSIEQAHQDTNFGALLTIWDRLFRTHVHDREVYPDTGITDPAFPKDGSGFGVLWAPFLQFAYPFRAIAADTRASVGRFSRRRSLDLARR